MSKKTRKVGEAEARYAVKKTAKVDPRSPNAAAVRYASPKRVQQAAEKVFKVHHELFRKLAQ
ncbi:MAG TPA: hypothetical protein VGM73_10450 [Candidatus Didemnitutus sp.]|jgi:hypothetical protein